jgi:glycosyltransferase involved in cell wall biosynthesis
MTALRVLFAPMLPENPYQRLLAEALAAQGVEVKGAGTRGLNFLADVRAFQPHVLHFHWIEYHCLSRTLGKSLRRTAAFLFRLRTARWQGVRLVWTAHNLSAHETRHPWLGAFVTRRVIRMAAAIIGHCETAKREILAFGGLRNPDVVTVIPHGNYIGAYPDGIERTAAREELGISSDRFVYLSLGHVRAYKGLDELVTVFLAEPPAETALLVIAGRAHSSEATEALRQRLHGVDRIRFDAGFVDPERIQTYINAADVVVLPYRDVFTSGSAVLAMSFGKPVIAPRIGCLGELLDGQDPLLYDPACPHGLVEALRDTWRERDRLPSIGARNRARAREWPWSRCAEATVGVYRKAVQG